jgi:hypothetical protein
MNRLAQILTLAVILFSVNNVSAGVENVAAESHEETAKQIQGLTVLLSHHPKTTKKNLAQDAFYEFTSSPEFKVSVDGKESVFCDGLIFYYDRHDDGWGDGDQVTYAWKTRGGKLMYVDKQTYQGDILQLKRVDYTKEDEPINAGFIKNKNLAVQELFRQLSRASLITQKND